VKSVRHTLTCTACPARITIEIDGDHELRSMSQAMVDLAEQAGWQLKPDHRCPRHLTERRRLCSCSQRHGLKHDADCWALKPAEAVAP
jgi:hypothetical protein